MAYNPESINIGERNKALDDVTNSYNNSLANGLTSSTNNPFSTPARDNYQTYPIDYFSGTDCKVFFGDIWVDDIITVQFNVNQSKTPIYGYASQYYQGIAQGQVIVNGMLAISFKETGYLNTIVALLEAQRNRSDQSIANKAQLIKSYYPTATPFIPGVTDIGDNNARISHINYTPNGTPDVIRAQETIESILMNKKGVVSSGFVSDYLGMSGGGKDFEDIAELLEDTIWGDSNGRPYDKNFQPTRLKRADEFDYEYTNATKVMPNNDFPVGIHTPTGHDYSKSLNILLTFGDINDYRAEHTIIALNDVHFTSQSVICSPNGDPIAEQYTFFARDINRNLGSNSIKINPIKLDIGVDNAVLSRYEDVERLGQLLNDENASNRYHIYSLSKFTTSWNLFEEYQSESYVTRRESLPFIDQLISDVERIINDPTSGTVQLSTDASQYVFRVVFQDAEGQDTDKVVILVVSQAVPNTYTYRVISPTRTNFAAFSTVSREDLWSTAAPPAKVNDNTLSSGSKQIEKKAQQVSPTSNTGIPAQFLPNTSTEEDIGSSVPGYTGWGEEMEKSFHIPIHGEKIETGHDTWFAVPEVEETTKYEFVYTPPTSGYQYEADSNVRAYTSSTTDTDVNSPEAKARYEKAKVTYEKNINKLRDIYGAEDFDKNIKINEGVRSAAEQKVFRDLYDRGIGAPAARVGYSKHEVGEAFDVDRRFSNDPRFAAAAKQAGYYQRYDHEPWHWELKHSGVSDPIKKQAESNQRTNNQPWQWSP